MRTLLYHTGALGDFITILPALSVWKNEHHDDSITLFGRPEIGSFARHIGCVDEAMDVTLPGYAHLFSPGLTAKTADVIGAYSHAIIFSSSSLPLTGHCRRLGLMVLDQPPFPFGREHVVDYHLSLFKDARLFSDLKRPRQPQVPVPGDSLLASFSLVPEGERFCVLHAGSGSRRKNWPLDRFVEIGEAVRNLGKTVVWLRGPAETSLRVPATGLTIDNPALPVLAAILSRTRLFLGNDSGVAHLSAAVGCRSIVLFGPSDPQVWSPRGERVRIIYKKVSCSPCHLAQTKTQSCDRVCLANLSADEVLSEVIEFSALSQ